MSAAHDKLLAGPHSLGAGRTIDLETLLAVSHVIGNLGVMITELQPELVDSLSRVLTGGAFHDPEIEFRLNPDTATTVEKRAELERCLIALRKRLRSINHQVD